MRKFDATSVPAQQPLIRHTANDNERDEIVVLESTFAQMSV